MHKIHFNLMLISLAVLLIISQLATAIKLTDFESLYGPSKPQQRILTIEAYQRNNNPERISYRNDVKPLLDTRCVVCHSCYDAPCQLKISSIEGLDRGATKKLVYDTERFNKIEPTRLFIDAVNTAGWREKEFFPVLNERINSSEAALKNSLLAGMLQLKRNNPLHKTGKLSQVFELDIERSLQCPSVEEFGTYQQKFPQWGMPYAMPGLLESEENTLLGWLKQGAKTVIRPPLSHQAVAAINQWESFFNSPATKEKLVARYIYEHLYIGHIHFQNHPKNEFYKLVRSTTSPGNPIVEITSHRPYQDPGTSEFYYRFRPVVSTIVDKNHFVYELSDQRMQRFQELFLHPDYTVTQFPTYQANSSSNPFKTFAEIPVRSRYKFLLDDAQYFFSGFIKGPVCRGQVAINVIRDRFWVVFINPDLEFADKSAEFLAQHSEYLNMPGADGDEIGLFAWIKYGKLGYQYVTKKDEFVNNNILKNNGLNLKFIWDGSGTNQNAALTVFRHFDNATVMQGLIGDTPLTGWVVDYPIFERIHYLLVAGFDVYGSVKHQVATRTYMDYIRMDAENNFIRFMPTKFRNQLHNSWYQGLGAEAFKFFRKPLYSIHHETAVDYKTDHYKKEFFQLIDKNLGKASGDDDFINRCRQKSCIRKNSSKAEQQIDQKIRKIAQFMGLQTHALPEVSFLRVKTGIPEKDLVYTILVNQSMANISFMFAENLRRTPEHDTVTVVPGFVGSYPNFFFVVDHSHLSEFVYMLKNARTESQLNSLYNKFGIRRTNPEIWQHSDWFIKKNKQENGLHAGIFDLNRYGNL